MWFTEAYIKNMFVKLIFKSFTLENSKKKGPNTLPRPGIRSVCLFRSAHLVNTVFPVRNKLSVTSALSKKIKNNGEEDEKI
jgi:hypothetical protein